MQKKTSSFNSARGKRLRRILLTGLGLILGLALAVAGFQFYKTWRARDLAVKARDNFDHGSYRLAWLQINSARDLLPDDAEVLRSSAIIDGGFGARTALDYWDRLAEKGGMTPDDLEQRARAAARFGTDEQFELALAELQNSGAGVAVGELRAGRLLVRGDVDRAIEEMRRLSSMSDDAAMRLDLARMLLRRHAETLADSRKEQAVAVARELFATVDALQTTPLADEALAFGLTYLLPGREGQERWANLGMRNMSPDNPALLPAATVLIDIGKAKPDEMNKRLRPIFDAAPLPRRAAYASWLTRHGMNREALALITEQEAAESGDAFAARVDALAALENWAAVVRTAEVNGNTPESVRFVTKARAEYAMGRGAQSGSKSVADALKAATRQANLPLVIALSDEMGASDTVDASLVELCGDPAVAAQVFRLTRDRFSRRGPAAAALMSAAFERARAAAPNAPPVQDFARYTDLLSTGKGGALVAKEESGGNPAVDPVAATADAVASEPADLAIRATHALALLRAAREAEALDCFEGVTIDFDHMTPGTQAVYCAALAAAGKRDQAVVFAGKIDASLLSPGELELVKGLR